MKRSKLISVFSLVIILTVILSSFPVCAQDGEKLYYTNDGSVLLSVNSAQGLSSEIAENPVFRDSGDKAVRIYGTSSADTTNPLSGKNYLRPYNAVINETTYAKTVVSFDFMLKNDGNGVAFRATQVNGIRTTFFKINAGEQVEAGTWNRVALVLSSDGVNFSYEVILNGVRLSSDNCANGSYGLQSNAWIVCCAAQDSEFDMYIDNIEYTGCDSYSMGGKPSVSSSSDEVTVYDESIGISSEMTVSGILSVLSCEDGAQINIYGSDNALLSSGSVLSGGEKAVVISQEGIYKFYNIISVLEKHWRGSETIKKATTLGGMTIDSAVSGAPVKTTDDTVYKISGTASTDMTYTSHGQGYVNLDLGSLIGDTKKYDSFSVEFDFLLAYEGTGVFFRGQQCIEDKTSYTGTDRQDFAIINEGSTYGGIEVENGKWYKLTVISDADNGGDDKGKCYIYLNGVFTGEASLKENAYGFYQFGWICPYVAKGNTFEMYLDNISVTAGPDISCGYSSAYIEGCGGNLALNSESKKIYNVNADSKVSEILSEFTLSSNTADAYVVDSNGAIQTSQTVYSPGFAVVLKSSDGLYTYYTLSVGADYACCLSVKPLDGSELYAVSMESDDPFYSVSTENAVIAVNFNYSRLNTETITSDNVYITKGDAVVSGVTLGYTPFGDYAENIIITAASLEAGTEYTVNIGGITASGDENVFMTGVQQITFVTKSSAVGESPVMPDMIQNKISSSAYSGWSYYGNTLHTLSQTADSEGNAVITASGRANSWQGVQQFIDYDRYYKFTGDEPGDTSLFSFSFRVRMDCADGEYAKISLAWIVDGSTVSGSTKNYTIYSDGSWYENTFDVSLTVPEAVSTASSAYLRIHVEGKKYLDTVTEFNDFSISGFSLAKYLPVSEINLVLDEDNIVSAIDGSAFGYAYEEDEWYYPDTGAVVVSRTSNQFKQSFLDYADGLGLNTIRIGGYLSNYDFWKCNIGPVEDRIPTKAPAPAWDTTRDYWRDGVKYIGNMEALDLAETINEDVSIILCTNIWSYLENIDYSETYTDAIEPSYIVDTATQTIDYDALDIAINDILDYVRFATLMPDDEKAVGTDGINWAQKRTDLGHSEPYNVTVWELGNELELRGVTGSTYAAMCEYIVPKLRAVFPDIKLAVCADTLAGSSNWNDGLMSSVNYVSTHRYYDYDSINSGVEYLNSLEAMINNSANPNLRILITEGGLDTFRDYEGPSNRSVAMCTSYAYFMNKAAHLNTLGAFTYYGNPSQFCYNANEGFSYGWRYYGDSSLEVTEETEGTATVVSVGERTRYQTGMQQGIPLSKFTEQGHNIGETAQYNISYDIKLTNTASSVEPITVTFEWHRDSSGTAYQTIYSEVISGYTSGEWITKSYDINLTIPEEFTDSAYMLIKICGNSNTDELSEISVKNLNVSKGENGDNLALNRSNVFSTENDDFRNTALADVIQYYMSNANGDIISAVNENTATSAKVSQLAIKTDDGIRLFISNLDDANDYKINLVSDKEYALSGKFIVYADSLYSERCPSGNDIYMLREYYSPTEATDSITIPKNSVMAVELTDLSVSDGARIADNITVENASVSLANRYSGEEFDIIAVFENDEKSDCFIEHVNSEERLNTVFSDVSDYKKMTLFKWNMAKLYPLAKKEVYNLGRMFPA